MAPSPRYDLEEATEYVQKALAIALKFFWGHHPIVAKFYNNMGMRYKSQGQLKHTAEHAMQALNIDDEETSHSILHGLYKLAFNASLLEYLHGLPLFLCDLNRQDNFYALNPFSL